MLFNGYTNNFHKLYHLTLAICISIFITACTSAPDSEVNRSKNSPENLKNISDDIVELIATDKATIKQQGIAQKALNNKNLYLAQQQEKLANVPESIVEQYKKAVLLLQQKQYVQAEKLFTQVINAQPDLSGAYVNKAIIALQQKDLIQANKLVEKAISVNALNPYAHHLKAQIEREQGDFKAAQSSYEKALAIWPGYAKAQLNLAILLELYRGQLLQAKQHYKYYLALQPQDKKVQRWLAGLKIKIKRAGLTDNDDEYTQDNASNNEQAKNSDDKVEKNESTLPPSKEHN
jgi:tetratricopeptide (TPR) repeat protein